MNYHFGAAVQSINSDEKINIHKHMHLKGYGESTICYQTYNICQLGYMCFHSVTCDALRRNVQWTKVKFFNIMDSWEDSYTTIKSCYCMEWISCKVHWKIQDNAILLRYFFKINYRRSIYTFTSKIVRTHFFYKIQKTYYSYTGCLI